MLLFRAEHAESSRNGVDDDVVLGIRGNARTLREGRSEQRSRIGAGARYRFRLGDPFLTCSGLSFSAFGALIRILVLGLGGQQDGLDVLPQDLPEIVGGFGVQLGTRGT